MNIMAPGVEAIKMLDFNQLMTDMSTTINKQQDRRGELRESLGRRKTQRFQIPGLKVITKKEDDIAELDVIDVSDGGANLSGTAEYHPGDLVDMQIKRPDGAYLPIVGEVCHCKSGNKGFNYGIRFLKSLPVILALYAPLGMAMSSDVQAASATAIEQLAELNAGDYKGSMQFGGLERTYRIHVPDAYDANQSTPLVFVFHGNREDGKKIQRYAGLDKLSDKLDAGFITVYPDAVDEKWSIRAEPDDRARGIDDVGFVKALLVELSQGLNIDDQRIYASGISRGGLFAMKLGCDMADSIAAVAAVASTMRSHSYHTDCNPSSGVSTMVMFGRDDPVMPFHGGDVRVTSSKILSLKLLGDAVSVNETVDFWADNNQCAQSTTTMLEDKKRDGTEVAKIEYSDCASGKKVVYYDIIGGGHTWAGTFGFGNKWLLGNTSRDVSAAEEMWKFFSTEKSSNAG